MNNLIKTGVWLFVVAITINVLETAWFGFHIKPSCPLEEAWDVLCALLVNVSICLTLIGLVNKIK